MSLCVFMFMKFHPNPALLHMSPTSFRFICGVSPVSYQSNFHFKLAHLKKLLESISIPKGKMYIFPGGSVVKMEKAMAPYSSTLAWKIPWTEKPGRLQSMGWLRVGHDWATSLSLFTFMHWRRKWQPTLVFLPGESQGRRSLVGCHLWVRTESDTTEVTYQQQQQW